MRTIRRRALALGHEGAGHPFRRSLPVHVFAPGVLGVENADEAQANARAARAWKMSAGDWQRFLSAYCLCFLAIFAYIL
ncbi:hypothetical protein MTR62_01030 [Novosphingobium sp. 1949]|uniref:Uncharacterized protein n=1 Tax=Novosphingobium organovorum TaxID=2930092 RepID=A0ABT0B8A3_9SPHN|nr:hypothetical protein [Novosphingobium organovorum]MCJ2181297.1 hypothetical protein [Novosphingobium organovorum]